MALAAGPGRYDASTFSCPECRGWHVEKIDRAEPVTPVDRPTPSEAFTDSLGTRRRRYFLVDIENPTRGAKATCEEVSRFWYTIIRQAPGVAPHDHVVVGASRAVAGRYRRAIHGRNVKWVLGANAPDAADRALLAAIDLRRVARDYDELVIISGDWRFADLARRASAAGLSVHVVTAQHPTSRSMLSRELAEAADIHSVIRLRSHSQRAQTIQATRAMLVSCQRALRQPVAA